jgi:hypothetical protein
MLSWPAKIAAITLSALPLLALSGALSNLTAQNARQSFQDWPTGPYRVMEN